MNEYTWKIGAITNEELRNLCAKLVNNYFYICSDSCSKSPKRMIHTFFDIENTKNKYFIITQNGDNCRRFNFM